MLGIKKHNEELYRMIDEADGIRLLGFKKTAGPLLKTISDCTALKIITKVPSIYDESSNATKEILDKDLFVSTLYDKASGVDTHEYSKKLVIV